MVEKTPIKGQGGCLQPLVPIKVPLVGLLFLLRDSGSRVVRPPVGKGILRFDGARVFFAGSGGFFAQARVRRFHRQERLLSQNERAIKLGPQGCSSLQVGQGHSSHRVQRLLSLETAALHFPAGEVSYEAFPVSTLL